MEIKGYIFDLDGVIVDTAKYHYLAWKELAAKLGITFTENDNERLKGVSRMRSLDIILEIGQKELPQAEKEKLATEKNDRYLEYINKLQPEEILPNVRAFITSAKDQGIKIALGSASKNAVFILEKLELLDLFDTIVDGTHVSKAKPDPEVFVLGAKGMGLNAENCVVFEDAEAGVEAAINAKMKVVGIGSADQLGAADIVITDLAGLTPAILEEKLNK